MKKPAEAVKSTPQSVQNVNRRQHALERVTVLVELMNHDLHIEPALSLSNDGLLGLQRILEDVRDDLDAALWDAECEECAARQGKRGAA